ncbi:MAG: PD40 domain-containing protein [Thermoplasmata archaeon]|nr:PD40 domain-containing protein [Thermoplasmata archaeon]
MMSWMKKVSSIGLVVVLMATLLMSFPFVSAKPPGACEPWPECKDGGGDEGPPANPAIAYQGRHRGWNVLMVMNADGSHKTPIHTQADGIPSWSPDGKSIAFQSFSGLWAINVTVVEGKPQGSNLTELLHEAGYWCTPAWSPAGDEIAFAEGPIESPPSGPISISIIPATGGTPEVLYSAPSGHKVRYPAWSGDATRIAFVEEDPSAGSLRTNTIKMLTQDENGYWDVTVVYEGEPGLRIRYLDWARTKDVLAYSTTLYMSPGENVYTLDLSQGSSPILVTEGRSPSWSPDDAKLVFDVKGDVMTIDLTSGETQTLAKRGIYLDWRR